MAGSLHDIRRRIRSVKNTQQITKAMKMVSAAKMRRATERVTSARPYAKSLSALLAGLAARVGGSASPLLARRDEREVLVVVVTGDKGLCGAFNTNVIRATNNLLARLESEGKGIRLMTIGRKGTDIFKRRKWEVLAAYPGIFAKVNRNDAIEIAKLVTEQFVGIPAEREGDPGVPPKVDAVYVVYNEFKSVISQIVRTDRLLPIELPATANEVTTDYIYEPSAGALLHAILPRHLEFAILRILFESAAAEHGARMTAMDGATKNAGEMIKALTLTYNRARQARITKELIEIVSGAAALD